MTDRRSVAMEVHLHGVRGSTPASGPEVQRVGGHTSCVSVRSGRGDLLVLDAGTGLRGLARSLGGEPLHGSILLTHLHWDHLMGLPFLRNADRDDATVDLYLPHQGNGDATELLAQVMSPPYFPIGPTDLRGAWSRSCLDAGTHRIEGFEVTAGEIAHKGGRTFGYRVAIDGAAIAYLPDHAPATATASELEAALRLADGVDVLLHDAQFVSRERKLADDYGHATIDDALAFADQAGIGQLVLFHHAPDRTDDEIDAIAPDRTAQGRPVVIGREGLRIGVDARAAMGGATTGGGVES